MCLFLSFINGLTHDVLFSPAVFCSAPRVWVHLPSYIAYFQLFILNYQFLQYMRNYIFRGFFWETIYLNPLTYVKKNLDLNSKLCKVSYSKSMGLNFIICEMELKYRFLIELLWDYRWNAQFLTHINTAAIVVIVVVVFAFQLVIPTLIMHSPEGQS